MAHMPHMRYGLSSRQPQKSQAKPRMTSRYSGTNPDHFVVGQLMLKTGVKVKRLSASHVWKNYSSVRRCQYAAQCLCLQLKSNNEKRSKTKKLNEQFCEQKFDFSLINGCSWILFRPWFSKTYRKHLCTCHSQGLDPVFSAAVCNFSITLQLILCEFSLLWPFVLCAL